MSYYALQRITEKGGRGNFYFLVLSPTGLTPQTHLKCCKYSWNAVELVPMTETSFKDKFR